MSKKRKIDTCKWSSWVTRESIRWCGWGDDHVVPPFILWTNYITAECCGRCKCWEPKEKSDD